MNKSDKFHVSLTNPFLGDPPGGQEMADSLERMQDRFEMMIGRMQISTDFQTREYYKALSLSLFVFSLSLSLSLSPPIFRNNAFGGPGQKTF